MPEPDGPMIAIIDHGNIVALDSPQNLIRGLGGDTVLLRGRIEVQKLKALPFVKDVKESKEGCRLSVENSGKNLQELLCAAGSVDFVEVHSPDLNDVFLHFTGKAMREEEGDTTDYVRDMNRARGGNS